MAAQIIGAHKTNIAVFFNLRMFARMERIVKSDYVQQRPDLFQDLHNLFRLILRQFVDVVVKKGNRLAFTELVMNLPSGRDDLSGNYDNWEGILENYETPKLRQQMDDRVVNRKRYREMYDELQKQKRLQRGGADGGAGAANQRPERVFTEEEDRRLRELFEKYKNIHIVQNHLIQKIVQELNTSDPGTRTEMIGGDGKRWQVVLKRALEGWSGEVWGLGLLGLLGCRDGAPFDQLARLERAIHSRFRRR